MKEPSSYNTFEQDTLSDDTEIKDNSSSINRRSNSLRYSTKSLKSNGKNKASSDKSLLNSKQTRSIYSKDNMGFQNSPEKTPPKNLGKSITPETKLTNKNKPTILPNYTVLNESNVTNENTITGEFNYTEELAKTSEIINIDSELKVLKPSLYQKLRKDKYLV